MKRSKLKLTVVLTGLLMGFGAVTAQANDGSKTRAQVKAELKEALARGQVYFNDVDYPPTPVFKSSKSREQVRNEVRQAVARGDILVDEIDYPPTPVSTGPGRSRAEVVAEMMEAKRNGTLQIDEVYYPDHRNTLFGTQLANKRSAAPAVAVVPPAVPAVATAVVDTTPIGAPLGAASATAPVGSPVETANAADSIETTSSDN